MSLGQLRPGHCPGCAHPPTPPRPTSPIRTFLHLPPAAAGCSIVEYDQGRVSWTCSCRHPFHAATPAPSER